MSDDDCDDNLDDHIFLCNAKARIKIKIITTIIIRMVMIRMMMTVIESVVVMLLLRSRFLSTYPPL